MNTLSAVFAMVVIVPALGISIAVWWMAASPRYRPTTSNPEQSLVDRLTTKVLLGLLGLGLVLFGPVAQLVDSV